MEGIADCKGRGRAPGDPLHPICGTFRRWQAGGCFDIIFTVVVLKLRQTSLLDVTIIHGDGTTTAVKKGGDNIGFNGQKKIEGDKVVAFCDRNCNVVAPFVAAPGNHNESPLLRTAMPNVMRIARSVGLDLQGTIVSLDGVYDCRQNREAIFNRGMVPNINANPRGRSLPSVAGNRCSMLTYSRNASIPSSAYWVGRISSAACCSGSSASISYIMRLKRWLYDDQPTPLLLASTRNPVSNCDGADRVVISHEIGMIKFRLPAHNITKPSHRRDNPRSSPDRACSPTLATPETRNQ